MELDGVSSEEIFDESPCFIVPDSQASESASEKNTGKTAVVLEGLKLLQPSKSFDQIGDSSGTDSGVLPNSSSSESHSHDTSSLTSKDDMSDELQDITKKHGSYITRSERARNRTGQIIVKETSSSSNSISPSFDMVMTDSLEEEVAGVMPEETNTTGDTNAGATSLSSQKENQQDARHGFQEKMSSGAFECLQLSGERNGSNDDVILLSSVHLRPESPSQIGEIAQEEMLSEKHKKCEQSTTAVDVNNEVSGSALPRWQQDMVRPDRASPVTGTLTRTSSNVSTNSSRSRGISTAESLLHQWQSPENDSDCDMFESDHPENPPPKASNPQCSSVSQQPDFKGLSPPELSQDIFQHKLKDNKATILESSSDKLEPSPTDDVVLPSQDDVFCLHLTQSQISRSQPQSQPDRLTTLVNMETQDTANKERNVDNENLPSQNRNNKNTPRVGVNNTVLAHTPIGHPSSTSHQPDIINAGQETRESPDFTKECISRCKMNESSESVESGLEGFHFSPPATLLKPVERTSPPPETNSDSVGDPSQEIVRETTEFRPISPDLITTSSDRVPTLSRPTVPTLSLSIPVPCEENTDDQGFNLQKDVVDGSKRSVFTELRFQPTKTSSPYDEIDPFEFRDEVASLPLSQRKRKSRDKSCEPGNKRRKSQNFGGINMGEDVVVNDGKERFWKTVKTRIVTTTTTLVDTHTEVTYTAQDGACIRKESNIEFGEATKKTTTSESERREEVDVVPSQRRNTEQSTTDASQPVQENPVLTTSRDEGNSDVSLVMKNEDKNVPDRTESCSISESISRQHKQRDLKTPTVSEPTKDKDIIVPETVDKSAHELSESTSTPDTISPPLFPASSDSSAKPDDSVIVVSTEERSKAVKQPANVAMSSTKQKRSFSVDNPRTSRRSSTSACIPRVLQESTRVFAVWYDKQYYPGHVVYRYNDGAKYRIEFDDGNRKDDRGESIIVVDYLPCDQPVMFCEETGGVYCDGVIRGFYKNGDNKGYKVLREDKRIVRCPRSNVMLSAEQAAIFLSLRDSMTSNNLGSLDDTLSDDELHENISKRERRSHEKAAEKSGQNVPPTLPLKSSEQRRKKSGSSLKEAPIGPLADRDTNTKQKTQGKREKKKVVKMTPEKDSTTKRGPKTGVLSSNARNKRKDECLENSSTRKAKETLVKHRNSNASETPKSNRKSTGKKCAGNLDKYASVDVNVRRVRRRLSSAMNSCHEKTQRIPTRSSPRKLESRAAAQNENLVLPRNKDVFRGYGFVLTGSDVTGSLNENSPGEEDEVYIRDDVTTQIRTGGGEVLKKFHEDYPRDSCFLLSNTCQTTAKYFNALVLGVPCLSHAWVRDCCAENRLISYNSYMLPAGRDLITEQLVEVQNYRNALGGLKVHLVGEDEFKQQWSEVLKAAGCEIIQKLPTNILQKLQHEDEELVCDVIVVGSGHVAHSTVQKARLLSIPTVTIHWVKQCILTGTKVDFNAHQSFIYRV